METERLTFVRDRKFYQSDKQTIEALRLVRTWPNAAEEFFSRGVEAGRIRQGPAHTQDGQAHTAVRRTRHLGQGHGL